MATHVLVVFGNGEVSEPSKMVKRDDIVIWIREDLKKFKVKFTAGLPFDWNSNEKNAHVIFGAVDGDDGDYPYDQASLIPLDAEVETSGTSTSQPLTGPKIIVQG